MFGGSGDPITNGNIVIFLDPPASGGRTGQRVAPRAVLAYQGAMASVPLDRRLSVAPMMDCTDRHCRYFLRLLSRRTLLYTEMIPVGAILHGDRERFLGFDAREQPVALQVGGAQAGVIEARRLILATIDRTVDRMASP
jgi:hypothetical protein